MVALKLDKWNNFPWHFQFAPLWFLLSIIFCCVLMFVFNVRNRRLNHYKRMAFFVAASTILLVTVLLALDLVELAKYLEGVSGAFAPSAAVAVMAMTIALFGLFIFGHYVQLDRQASRQRNLAGNSDTSKAREIVLEFIQAPEDVFIRESSNLFRKHGAKPVDAVILPRVQDFRSDDEIINEECMICCIDGAEYVLLECGHGNFCSTCSKEMAKRNMCPLCRQVISRVGKLGRKTLEQGGSTYVVMDSVALVATLKSFSDDDGTSSAESDFEDEIEEGIRNIEDLTGEMFASEMDSPMLSPEERGRLTQTRDVGDSAAREGAGTSGTVSRFELV